jgi:hypothetical protein
MNSYSQYKALGADPKSIIVINIIFTNYSMIIKVQKDPGK